MIEVKPESLILVGEALATTLNDACACLESFAEGEDGSRALERCADLLHVAKGALQLTETYGGSLLAEEMEETCRYTATRPREGAATEEGAG